LDAITVEILRNKIASLVEEMHYHFYRSGYSTIIRESRDFSCVILDHEGRLIVAPPMFFHAPVYRHLVSRIRAAYGCPTPCQAAQSHMGAALPSAGLPGEVEIGALAARIAGEAASPQAPGGEFAVAERPPHVPPPASRESEHRAAFADASFLSVAGEGIRDGDVFVSNHPYEGGLPHVSDMAFVAPVFADGKIVAFAGSIAHKADLGGAVAGSTSANATEMYQEGLLVPPIKIRNAGRPLPDIERLILANSRQPALVRGDMNAQIAVTQMGAARVKELCARFGADTLCQAFAAILRASASGLRGAIAKLPSGVTASAEGFLDSDGVVMDRPIKLAVTVTVENGVVSFDFSASAPQAAGPVNLRPSMVEACVFYCLIGLLDPKLAFNDGMRDGVRLVFAPRTVVNAEPPAAVSNYQMVNLKLVDVILEALAKLHPARAVANAGSSSALSIAWRQARPGQSTMQYEIIGSAYGGGSGYDGASATATHLSNLHITPIEILEAEFPCRITRFDLVPDSGGAGRWRGGLSMRREYELLADATVIRRFDKSRFPPQGLAAGGPGGRSRFVVRLGAADEFEAPASGRFELKAGERFLVQSAGGGGYGNPRLRDRSAIDRDMAEGYVSAAGTAAGTAANRSTRE
jgi:N-methylhydantoinase B